ncbi:MAG: hypothetical protein F6K14_25610 [Symploca sp. SIO2C1]|nr:hypothetical protein [Symploca sp. SIO2C1]
MDEQERNLPNSTLQGELLTAPKYLTRILKSQEQELDNELSPLTKLSLSELDIAGGCGGRRRKRRPRPRRRKRRRCPGAGAGAGAGAGSGAGAGAGSGPMPPSPPQEEDPFPVPYC